jgi:hypothetical protein
MSIEANKRLVRDFWTAFSACEIDKALAMLHDDLKWWVAGTIPNISGTHSKKELEPLMKGMLTEVPKGITITPEVMTAESDRVAVAADSYGQFKNGKIYNNKYHLLHYIKDGKIVEVREYMDTMHANEIFGS